jgi:hypothetical protein
VLSSFPLVPLYHIYLKTIKKEPDSHFRSCLGYLVNMHVWSSPFYWIQLYIFMRYTVMTRYMYNTMCNNKIRVISTFISWNITIPLCWEPSKSSLLLLYMTPNNVLWIGISHSVVEL